MLLGFLHRGGIEQWSYAIGADVVAQGDEFIRFRSEDVDFKKRVISAQIWKDGQWVEKISRFPDAIRNFELQKGKDRVLEIVPYSLGPIVRKDDQMELFSRTPLIEKYIPKSINVDQSCNIIQYIQQWEAGLLKPARGRLGQGIIFIKVNGKKFDINDDGKVTTVSKIGLKNYLRPYYLPNAKPYILQQFAAGTGPENRYFNIRVIVTKGGDGDWHGCNFLMSLLAQPGSIIANRDVGAKNIDLDAFLQYKYGKKVEKIYNNFFEAAVQITRVLDDCANNSAEEIALDMAIDNDGQIWLHEANWRGGMWLFNDDVGLYRHGGANLHQIALQNQLGSSIDISRALNIAVNHRESLQAYSKKEKNCHTDDVVVFGLNILRKSSETVTMMTQAIVNGLPIISLSSHASFRNAQRTFKDAIGLIQGQIPNAQLPLVLSRGGAIVHDPRDERGYQKQIKVELLDAGYVSKKDLEKGFSINADFLNYTISQNRKDMGLPTLDLFIIEGLEYSLDGKKDWKLLWQKATRAIYENIRKKRLKEWGFALDARSMYKRNALNPEKLLEVVSQMDDVIGPVALYINITSDYRIQRLKSLVTKLNGLDIRLIFSLNEKVLRKKEWNEYHEAFCKERFLRVKEMVKSSDIVLASVDRLNDCNNVLNTLHKNNSIDLVSKGNPWVIHLQSNKAQFVGCMRMKRETKRKSIDKKRLKNSMQALATFAKFDHKQLWRFFVDGRFHKKYQGWTGYEANEPGSIPGLLKAYCHVFDNFDISEGLKPSYIRELHAFIMKNVLTKNPKSAPGDMRYLEAGFNIFSHYSTIDSIAEILERHKCEGVPLFHTRGFDKPADEFTVQEVYDALQDKKRLKFRPWYPVLTQKEKNILEDAADLEKFYEVKHNIQKQFAIRIDNIVQEYNSEIEKVKNEEETLIAISRVVRNLEMLHPFPDGNGRLCVAVLMNHLLLFHGFLPAILFDPNIDIELSVKEFAQEIKRGIENTKLLLKDPDAILYDYSIRQATSKENDDFEVLAKDLIIRLSPYADLTFDGLNLDNGSVQAKYLYLTPKKLAHVSKGDWINIKDSNLESLRFESIHIDEVKSSNQLYVLRNISDRFGSVDETLDFIKKQSVNGVKAIVTDNLEIARKSYIPALWVENIDDALAIAARTAKREINCKAIAIVGSENKRLVKRYLRSVLNNQIQINQYQGADNKTPHIMTSLANLRLSDNLEINEIDVKNRPNPVSYRARRVEPNICLLTNLDEALMQNKRGSDVLTSFAAISDGIKDGGLYIINSQILYLTELIDAIAARSDVAVQTYGDSKDDTAQLISAIFDENKKIFYIEAKIIGQAISYRLKSDTKSDVYLSLGVLLTIENMGYDTREAAKKFSSL